MAPNCWQRAIFTSGANRGITTVTGMPRSDHATPAPAHDFPRTLRSLPPRLIRSQLRQRIARARSLKLPVR